MKKTFLYIILMVITATVFGQNVYVVTKTTDPNPFTYPYKFNDADCDPVMFGTLQWAINKSNDDNAESIIEFNIPGTGVQEILINSYLPQIKSNVIIDGTTQAGYTIENPVIKINGQFKVQFGFSIYGADVKISGLHIANFSNNAFLLFKSSNSEIIDNVITNIYGSGIGLQVIASNNVEIYGNDIESNALNTSGKAKYGVYIDQSENCIIGSTDTGKANTIANCTKAGVAIASFSGNKISGNIIYNNSQAIMLAAGANGNIQPPVITSYSNGILSGTALPNSTVEIFGSTGEENANEYLGSVVLDEHADWSVQVSTEYDYFAATQRDGEVNSSGLSDILQIPTDFCLTPNKPENINVFDVGKNMAKITWSKVFAHENEIISYYYVIDTVPNVQYGNGIINGIALDTSVFITGLDYNKLFYMRLFSKSDCNNLTSDYTEHFLIDAFVKESLFVELKDNLGSLELEIFNAMKDEVNLRDEVFYFKKIYEGLSEEKLQKYYHIGCGYNIDSIIKQLVDSDLFAKVIIEPKIDLTHCCDNNCMNSISPTGEQNILDESYAYELLNLPCAWGITKGNTDINIAVLDQNFYSSHPDLLGRINSHTSPYTQEKGPEDPDPDPIEGCMPDHGLAVSGIIAANPYNEIGFTGAGYDVTLNTYAIITDVTTSTYMSDLHSQISQAISDGNKIINISYRFVCYSDFPNDYPGFTPQSDSEIFQGFVNDGSTIVLSGGNTSAIYPINTDYGNKYQIAGIPGVIIVGGVDVNNKVPYNPLAIVNGVTDESAELADFAFAINQHVTVCAPAKDVYTTTLSCNGQEYVYSKVTGTSIAAPLVAATAGLMLSINPYLTPQQIEEIIVAASVPVNNRDFINNLITQTNENIGNFPNEHYHYFTAGTLDSYAAVLIAANYNNYSSNNIEAGTTLNINELTCFGNTVSVEGTININSDIRLICKLPAIHIKNGGVINLNSNGNILANDLDFFYGEIIIESGGTMEINSGAILNLFDAEIRVKAGGILIIDGAVITNNCGDLWKGITVEGDFANPSGPGKLYIKNNASIEYAETAVSSSWNGLVRITGSNFINCPTGIYLYNYNENFLAWSAFPNLKPRAYVNTCDFITNENYVSEPSNHMDLRFIDKITLKGNTYSNISSSEALSGSARGNGINSINSGLRVIENRHFFGLPDSPMTPEDKSRFEGLYYGIYAQNTSPQQMIIRNCDFIEYEKIGTYIKASNLSTITSNTFTSNAFGEVAGLYLQNCGGYQVENNTFNDWVRGLVVNSSSTSSNEIYRNKFNSNTYSLSAYYNNANSTGYQGLFMQCNDFNQNIVNFDANIFVAKGDVKKEQGHLNADNPEYSVSAANQFETSMLSGAKAFKTYNTNFNYKYYYNMPSDVTDISGLTSDNVETQAINTLFNDIETCESKLPGIKPIVGSEHIAIKKSLISSKADSLENLVDGGNTPATLQKVQNLRPNNFNKTCNELLQISPYLSDTVLCSFMQTSVNGHVVAKTNVLLVNSPLPPNAAVELANMDLPQPHKALIYQHQIGTNAVVIKQQEIGQLEYEKDLLVDDFVRYRLQNDSVPELKNEAMEYLINDDSPVSNSLAIQILISDGKYSEASYQLDLLESKTTNLNDKERVEYFDFVGLQRIIIKTDTTYNVDEYLEIIETNQTFIEEIAYNPDHKCSSQAQTLLTIAGLAVFEPEFIIPLEDRFLKLNTEQENLSQNFIFNDLIEVYPTPASNEIWIEYLILKERPMNKIDIYNIEGKLVLTQPIRNGFGVEQVDISQLSEGNYILKLGEFTKQISVIK